MRIFNVALNIVDTINEWYGKIFGFPLVLVVFVVVYDVVLRYFFNRPTIGGMEISQMLMLIIVVFVPDVALWLPSKLIVAPGGR